jgi:hypothetical protein
MVAMRNKVVHIGMLVLSPGGHFSSHPYTSLNASAASVTDRHLLSILFCNFHVCLTVRIMCLFGISGSNPDEYSREGCYKFSTQAEQDQYAREVFD